MEKSFKTIERLDQVVKNLIQDYGYDSKIEEVRVFSVWKDTVGGFIARNTKPSSLIDGKFCIWVKNSVLLSELHLLSSNLIEKINSNQCCCWQTIKIEILRNNNNNDNAT